MAPGRPLLMLDTFTRATPGRHGQLARLNSHVNIARKVGGGGAAANGARERRFKLIARRKRIDSCILGRKVEKLRN